MSGFYLDLLPWVVYWFSLRSQAVGARDAALFALATVVLLAVRRRSAAPRRLHVFALALFSGLFVGSVISDLSIFTTTDARALAAGVLGLVLIAASRRGWFLAPYLATEVPLRERARATFNDVSGRLARRWGATGLCLAALQAIGNLVASSLWTTAFHWLLPMAAVLHCSFSSRRTIDESFDLDFTLGDAAQLLGECVNLGAESPDQPARHLHVVRGNRAPAVGQHRPD
jgi:hypothetical protein